MAEPLRKFDPHQGDLISAPTSTVSKEQAARQTVGAGQRTFLYAEAYSRVTEPVEGQDQSSHPPTSSSGIDYHMRSRVAPVVVLRRPSYTPESKFAALQKWEGSVLSVSSGSFTARLVDQNGGVDEEAEISLEEISPQDRPLVEPGAVFYWHIGYIDLVSGQRRRASEIRFRRLPVWSREDIEKARRKAEQIGSSLDW